MKPSLPSKISIAMVLRCFGGVFATGAMLVGCACTHPVVEPNARVVVTDPSGHGVAGANVTLTNDSGVTDTLVPASDGSGSGSFDGTYGASRPFAGDGLRVHVDAPGFATVDRAVRDDEMMSWTGCGETSTVRVQLAQ